MSNTETYKSADFAHVEFRPILDHGDHRVVSSIYDADYFGAYATPAGEPACRVACFDEPGEALDYIFAHPKFAHCGDDDEYAELGEKLGYDAEKTAALTEAVRATRS